MASPSVHVATGKCGVCGLQFEKYHFNITITRSRKTGDRYHEKVRVCKTCAHEYFARGE